MAGESILSLSYLPIIFANSAKNTVKKAQINAIRNKSPWLIKQPLV